MGVDGREGLADVEAELYMEEALVLSAVVDVDEEAEDEAGVPRRPRRKRDMTTLVYGCKGR